MLALVGMRANEFSAFLAPPTELVTLRTNRFTGLGLEVTLMSISGKIKWSHKWWDLDLCFVEDFKR